MRCSGCSHRWYQAAPDAPQPPLELPPALQEEFGIETPTPPAALVTAPLPEPTPEQLAWAPAPEPEEEPQEDSPRPRTLLKNIIAVLLGLGFTAASALLWVPGLGKLDLPRITVPAIDLSQVPWLDRLVNPPPKPANPLIIAFTTDHQALADGRPLFVIAGTIANPTDAPQKVASITGRLVGPANTVTFAWRIASPVATLAPHQRVAFDSSAIGEPYGGERVTLRFAD